MPSFLTRPMVVLLPLIELAVAVALIPTALAWYGAWGALALLLGFLGVIAVAMVRGRNPDCHCFGQLHSSPVGWPVIVRNLLLGFCAVWLIARGRGHSGPAVWAWFSSLDAFESKVAMVAACAVAFLFVRVLLRARAKPEPVEIASEESVEAEAENEVAAAEPEEEVAAPRPRPATVAVAIEAPKPDVTHPLDIGLDIGTPAPEFELPALDGETRSLQSLRAGGRDVMLIFSSPFCKSCEALASNLVQWTRGWTGLPQIVVISRGSVRDNLDKLKGLQPSQVLLQRKTEVAHAYDCSATPTAVLIGADGLIRTQLVSGGLAIKQLILSNVKREDMASAKTKSAQRASVFGG